MSTNLPNRKQGDPISHRDHNQMVRTVNGLSRQFSTKDKDKVLNKRHPFEVFNLAPKDIDAGTWEFRVYPGFIIHNNIRYGPVIGPLTPTVNGSPMTDDAPDNPLRMEITGGGKLWLQFSTDNKGQISGTPSITTTQPTVQHHYPESPDAPGQDGEYGIEIATFELTDSIMRVKDVKLRDNYDWGNQLIQIENLGTGARVYKIYDNASDKHDLRTLKETGTEPSGSNVYDVWVKPYEDGDEIKFESKVSVPGGGGSTSLEGSDYIHVVDSNDPKEIYLANANNTNIRPDRGDTGFYVFYTAAAGQVKKTAVYCIDPVDPTTQIGPSLEVGFDTGGTS